MSATYIQVVPFTVCVCVSVHMHMKERGKYVAKRQVNLGRIKGLFIIWSFSVFVGLKNSELRGDSGKENMGVQTWCKMSTC